MKAIWNIKKNNNFEDGHIILYWPLKKDKVNVVSLLFLLVNSALTPASIITASAILYHSLNKFSIST